MVIVRGTIAFGSRQLRRSGQIAERRREQRRHRDASKRRLQLQCRLEWWQFPRRWRQHRIVGSGVWQQQFLINHTPSGS